MRFVPNQLGKSWEREVTRLGDLDVNWSRVGTVPKVAAGSGLVLRQGPLYKSRVSGVATDSKVWNEEEGKEEEQE
jgi:hypothetical protein